MDILNSKVSSLLTHVSIMIAILTSFLSQFGDREKLDAFSILVVIEIIGYLAITICCIRGVWITNRASFSGHENGPEAVQRIVSIVRTRRRLYAFSLHGTIWITVLFLATLYFKFVGSQ